MDGKRKEEWMRLCELAAVEKDPQRLIELVTEINRLLQEKEDRLAALRRAEQFLIETLGSFGLRSGFLVTLGFPGFSFIASPVSSLGKPIAFAQACSACS